VSRPDEAPRTIDRSAIDRALAANRYLVLGTAGPNGDPWVSPVFFAPLDQNRVVWVSSPDSRHSRNIAHRAAVAFTVFDSNVEVGQAEAIYVDADAAPATADETERALQALNSRLPKAKRLTDDDLHPLGPMVVYRADLRHRYVLVRGGDRDYGNAVDMTVEV
jgi:nitroimidazol reductase NimA-like FMN-containing flavoprotein (pyridoxamine 5'-phosphate oxidase superfamily)